MKDSSGGFNLTRTLLVVMLVALGACAAIGIVVFLFGEFSDTEMRMLGTCGVTAYASLTGLSCAVALERQVLKLLAVVGMAVSCLTWVVLTAGIWTEFFHSDVFAKVTAILAMFAAALAHTGLLSLARLRPGYGWPRHVTISAVFLLVTTLSGILIFEKNDEGLARFVGVLSILVALGTLTVPILHRLSGVPLDQVHTTDRPEEIELVCPRCHRRQRVFLGEAHCQQCELSINVQISGWEEKVGGESGVS